MQITYALDLPLEVETVPVVRGLLRASMVEIGVEAECIDDISLALTEACANVVAHAAAAGAVDAAGYRVEVTFDKVRCEIKVIDDGGGFDPEKMLVSMPGTDAERGRGLAIIDALMDGVAFSSVPGVGTTVTFHKHLTLEPDSKIRPFVAPAETPEPQP
jgi:serine/threonine-protein kinase RsbW